jgi:hypothetical protein
MRELIAMMRQKKASRPAELGQILGKLRQSSASQLFFLTHGKLIRHCIEK